MKHTPGPWEVDYGGTKGHIKSVSPELDITPTICKYGEVFDGYIASAISVREQDKANAKLIAKSPELLESLIDVLALAVLKYGNLNPEANIVFDRANQIIREATA